MGRPRKYRTEAERRKAHAEASRRYRIRRGQPVERRRLTYEEEAERQRVRQRRRRLAKLLESMTDYGLDAFWPGSYWETLLEWLPQIEEAEFKEVRERGLPPIPLPEPFETEIVEKRAVEILSEERKKARESAIERLGGLTDGTWHPLAHPERYTAEQRADAVIMKCFVPQSKYNRRIEAMVERWGWSNPKRPLSDYKEDLEEIKRVLREGLGLERVRWTWAGGVCSGRATSQKSVELTKEMNLELKWIEEHGRPSHPPQYKGYPKNAEKHGLVEWGTPAEQRFLFYRFKEAMNGTGLYQMDAVQEDKRVSLMLYNFWHSRVNAYYDDVGNRISDLE